MNCASTCVDPLTDRAHCGACGVACARGHECRAGRCELACPASQSPCGDVCASLDRDPLHCGACDARCAAGDVCLAGRCTSVCPAGFTSCDGRCVDTRSEPAHCGRCAAACVAPQTCRAGACRPPCAATETPCGDACADVTTSRAHCGACGRACAVTCANRECTRAVQLAAGWNATCALLSDGTVWCWGFDFAQQTTARDRVVPRPIRIASIERARRIGFSGMTLCAVTPEGLVRCLGENRLGQCGFTLQGSTVETYRTAISVPIITNAIDVVVGDAHACAVQRALGGFTGASCWGWNLNGALGNELRTGGTDPTNVTELGNISAVGVGTSSACALASETPYCWGTIIQRPGEPEVRRRREEITPAYYRRTIAVARDYACSASARGERAVCWGSRYDVATRAWLPSDLRPVPVPIDGVVEIVPGQTQVYARTAAGEVYAWGGRLVGVPESQRDSVAPVRVAAPPDVTQLAVGAEHLCVLRRDGSVECAGANDRGQLGVPRDLERHTFAPVAWGAE